MTHIYIRSDNHEPHPLSYFMVKPEDRGEKVAIKADSVSLDETYWLVVVDTRHSDSSGDLGGQSEITAAFTTFEDAHALVEGLHDLFKRLREWNKGGPNTVNWKKQQQWIKDNPRPVSMIGPDGATYSIEGWIGWGTGVEGVRVIPVRYVPQTREYGYEGYNWNDR